VNERIFIDRPPRIQPELPVGSFKIPAPPAQQDQGMRRLLQAGLPLVAVIVSAFVYLTNGSGRGVALIAVMAATVLTSAGLGFFTYFMDKRKEAAQAKAYLSQLVAMNKEMERQHGQQRRFYTYNYPDADMACALPARPALRLSGKSAPCARRRASGNAAPPTLTLVRCALGWGCCPRPWPTSWTKPTTAPRT
jgi:hypothetical protein